jgi:hypothetical protein
MMKLQTPVADEKCKVGISYQDRTLMLGSCFSDNIGRQLADFGFDICVNPFGTLYNPISILQSIELLTSDRMFGTEDCVQIGAGDERWCSFSHHTSFARELQADFLDNANRILTAARAYFSSCNRIIITLGTAWCFRNVASGRVVSNCLKRPASEFIRERLSSAEVTQILTRIARLCPGKQFIFTVSPIRHFKDGAHGNQISKSALLLGIDDFLTTCHCTPSHHHFTTPDKIQQDSIARDNTLDYHADYFPAYEIMMDELRDYRFYTEDMCHPSQQAVNYIRERFLSWALPADELPRLEEKIRTFRHSLHISK